MSIMGKAPHTALFPSLGGTPTDRPPTEPLSLSKENKKPVDTYVVHVCRKNNNRGVNIFETYFERQCINVRTIVNWIACKYRVSDTHIFLTSKGTLSR
jgi:hypothetical protein